MKDILDELSLIKILRMGEDAVGDFENGSWMIFDHPQGKFIVDSTLQVGAVLPWLLIKTLAERSKRKFFEWSAEDGSLSVHGKDGCWDLVFRMSESPYCLVSSSLSAAETQMMKQHLFTK